MNVDKRKWLILLLFFIILSNIILFKDFIFGNKAPIFLDVGSDTYYSYYRAYYFLIEHIRNWSLPSWSFQMGVGTNIVTLYPYLYDPFSLIYYIVGSNNLSSTMIYVVILKSILSGYFAFIYFQYLKFNYPTIIICSYLFSFNSYSMIWGQHYYFSSWVVFLPLILYSVELWLREGKWLKLWALSAIFTLNIYNFYQTFIFIFIYFLVSFYAKYNFNHAFFLKKTGGFIAIVALGLSTAAVLILPEIYLLQSSPRVSSGGFLKVFESFFELNTHEYYYSIFCRFFSNNLQGIGSNYVGFLNYYESFQLYSSILFLLLLPQTIRFDKRLRNISLISIAVVFCVLFFPFFSTVMNGFQYPSYRWGFGVVFLEILLLGYMIDVVIEHKILDVKLLFLTILVLISYLLLINFHYINTTVLYNHNIQKIIFMIVLMFLYAGLFILMARNYHNIYIVMLLVLLSSEMILEYRASYIDRSLLSKNIEENKKIDLFGYTSNVVSYLRKIDPSFYRIDKNRWILSLNDSLVQGYFGLDSYDSLNTPSYYDFIRIMNIPLTPGSPVKINTLGWTSLQRPVLADILSTKYYLTKDNKVTPKHVKFIKKIGDIYIYERNNSLPFGFTYNSYLNRDMFFSLIKKRRDIFLLRGFLPSKSDTTIMKYFLEISSKDEGVPVSSKKDYMLIQKFAEDRIEGNLSLDNKKMLFLSIPYDKGWSAKVNGINTDIHKINIGFSGVILNKGYNHVVLEYHTPYLRVGGFISFISFIIVFLCIRYIKGGKGE